MVAGAAASSEKESEMINDFSVHINFSLCMHRRVILDTCGGMHFSGGECWDDIQERLLCIDCMAYVTQAEVRAAWGQVPVPNEEASNDHA
jgi:hypothetical protein